MASSILNPKAAVGKDFFYYYKKKKELDKEALTFKAFKKISRGNDTRNSMLSGKRLSTGSKKSRFRNSTIKK